MIADFDDEDKVGIDEKIRKKAKRLLSRFAKTRERYRSCKRVLSVLSVDDTKGVRMHFTAENITKVVWSWSKRSCMSS